MPGQYPASVPYTTARRFQKLVESVPPNQVALISTYEDFEDFVNELKADSNSSAALANDLKAKYDVAVALLNELRSDYNDAVATIVDIRARVDELNLSVAELVTVYGAHLADSVAHNSADVTNVTTEATPTPTSAPDPVVAVEAVAEVTEEVAAGLTTANDLS